MKSKIKEWAQFLLMFYIILLVLGAFASLMSSKSSLSASYDKFNCIIPIYFYSGERPYEAAICVNKNSGVLLVRIYNETPQSHSINNPSDIVFFIIMFTGGIYAWFKFIRKLVRNYMPWL